MSGSDHHPLDRPTWSALTGPHARFAERHGRALRYPPAVSPFLGLPAGADAETWADAAALVGPGGTVVLLDGSPGPAPDGWATVDVMPCLQLEGSSVTGADDGGVVPLTAADTDDMVDLATRTRPGPFSARTPELGAYLWVRRDGRLVAMAGERLHPPGWTEVSAVCTDPSARGEGLAARLVLAVAAGIVARGELPFLHVLEANAGAVRVYQRLGFRTRRRVDVPVLRAPG